MPKISKIKKRVSHREFTPALRAASKKKPRGRPFPKGDNPIGRETRFVKGMSGNPGGRPKTAKLNEALREALAANSRTKLPTETNAQYIAKDIIEQAKKGNLAAAICAGDRAEGRPNISIALDDSRDQFSQLIIAMHRRSEIAGPPEDSNEDDSPPLLLEVGSGS
jgi:uncharacterized protein DUF5681